MTSRRVYLAGDLVFRPDCLAIFERLRAICRNLGLEGVSPLDGQGAVAGLPSGEATILAIVAADRHLMDGCDGGLFCLDPFRRAADMDPGAAVEIGYMFGQGNRIGLICYADLFGRQRPAIHAFDAAPKAWMAGLRRPNGG